MRAYLTYTVSPPKMANRVEGGYITTEFGGSLVTDTFEVEFGLFVHLGQHRNIPTGSIRWATARQSAGRPKAACSLKPDCVRSQPMRSSLPGHEIA